MVYYNRYILAGTDITSKPKMLAKYRGKVAKEVYRCAKGVCVTGTVKGPVLYAVAAIPKEVTSGFIYSSIGNIGETLIGYISGIGFCRWIYRGTNVVFLKNTARIIYNVASLPITCYSKGVSSVFDLLQLSKLEEKWFGSPVYLFDDNRLWIESNFTLEDAFKGIINKEE